MKYYQPEVYFQLVKDLNERKTEREEFVQQIVAEVSHHMENAHIQAKVYGRVKHFFSIYKKMVNQNKTLDQVYDLFAVRIIVDSVKDCYAALGVIHEMYTPIPGRFKDYIAMPKANMYQSLHTTLMGPAGQPFEIQIRTEEMHKTAEYGIAAHWKYKESGGPAKNNKSREEEKLSWLRQILEWQRDMSDNREFLSLLKGDLDLFAEDVYCFTPNGDVKNLPNGSTPVDFAYAIHSAVGNKMVGARVNGKLVNIDYKIQNGDRIEILTSQNSKGPSRDWLNIVKSTQAKNKINQWFKHEFKEENIIRGIVVKGIDDMAVRFSKCCNPVPGDEIVGFVTRGRGMTIHRTDCVNMLHLSAAERERLIDAEWENNAETEGGGQYLAELKMYANDRQGLLLDVTKVFTEEKIDVRSMNTRTSKKGTATLEMGFIVKGREQLNLIIKKLRNVEGVLDIERTAG